MYSLQEAVRLLTSEKAKERSEGIEQYREIFQDDNAIRDFNDVDDTGKRWLFVMQGLFTCVVHDKMACSRGNMDNAAPISLRRLKDSAQMVFWMVEKTCPYYPMPVFSAVFKHLTQMLEYRGRVLEPIANDYIKAIRVTISYRPHLEHLEASSWAYAVALCFNILLDDDIREELNGADIRHLLVPIDTQSITVRASRLLDAEVASCLQILVASSSAPLLGKERYGLHILDKYASFLLAFPSETTAHLPVLQGMNAVLSQLEVNETNYIKMFAIRTWPSLLHLWSSKSRQIKEQFIVTLSILLPAMTSDVENAAEVSNLQRKLLEETEQRFALTPLSSNDLEFCNCNHSTAFQYQQLRLKGSSSATVIQPWSTLELAADCAIFLYANKFTPAEQGHAAERPRKRPRRSERDTNPIEESTSSNAFDMIIAQAEKRERGHEGKAARWWALQILLFASLRSQETQAWMDDVLDCAIRLLGSDDAEIQNWSLLIIGSMSRCVNVKEKMAQVWPIVVKRAMQSSTSRAGSQAARVILNSVHLQQREIADQLESCFDNLVSQGPLHLSDSICSFFTDALSAISKEAGGGRSTYCEKLLSWIHSVILMESFSSKSSEAFNPYTGFQLFAQICDLPLQNPLYPPRLVLPNSPIVMRQREEHTIKPIRHFLSHSQFITAEATHKVQKYLPRNANSTRNLKPMEMQCINVLQRKVSFYLQQMEEGGFVASCTIEQLLSVVNAATFALIFHALLQMNGTKSQQQIVNDAHKLIAIILALLKQARWAIAESATVLSILQPLVQIKETEIDTGQFPLERPGSESGIPNKALTAHCIPVDAVIEQWQGMMKLVWKDAPSSIAAGFIDIYEKIMQFKSYTGSPTQRTTSYENDVWADHGTRRDTQQQSDGATSGSVEQYVVDFCVSAAIHLSQWTESGKEGLQRLKQYLLSPDISTSTKSLLSCGYLVFGLNRWYGPLFTLEELEQMLQTIGDDMMSVYKYSSNTDTLVLAIDFLDSTMSQWAATSATKSDLFANALKLCRHFIKQTANFILHWKVDLRIGALLEHYLNALSIQDSPLLGISSTSMSPESIINNIIGLNARPDMRVRWMTCKMTARMFPIWSLYCENAIDLYANVDSLLPKETSSLEMMITRNLCQANAIVASSPCRHLALYHLLELPMVEDTFNTFTRAILDSSCRLLGFTSTREVWMLFATQIVYAALTNNYTVDKLPFDVLGYDSQSQMLTLSFEAVASMLAAIQSPESMQQWKTLMHLSAKTEKEGMVLCLPFLTAVITSEVTKMEGNLQQRFNTVVKDMKMMTHLDGTETGEKDPFKKALRSSLDVTVFDILRLFYEPDLKTFLDYMRKNDSTSATLLLKLKIDSAIHLHEPSKPMSAGVQVYLSLKTIHAGIKETFSAATAYSVIHQLVHLIHQERMSNDQHRHVQALKVFLAMAHQEIEMSPAILRLLCHSCCVMMGLVDLVETLWPLLEWITGLIKSAITGVSSCYLLLLRHARRFSRSSDAEVAQIGTRVSDRLGRLFLKLKEIKGIKSMAIEAICAWPDEHPATLAPKRWEIDIDKLTRALHSTLTVSAPYLNRVSRALQKANEAQIVKFSSSTIWTILDCLQKESLSLNEKGEIAASLADVLYHCHGHISAPIDAESQRDYFNRTLVLTAVDNLDGQSMQPLQTLKSWLTWRLLLLTRSDDLDCASKAIRCLRAVFTVEPSFAGSLLKDWTNLDIEELQLIKAFPVNTVKRAKRNRNELESEESVRRSLDYREWLCWISELLCDLMSVKEECASIGCLSNLVTHTIHHATFIEEIFPVIVHIFLRSDLFLVNKKQRLDTKAISRHFNLVLRSSQTHPHVWKAILGVIIQLRHDAPTSDALDCDRWIWDLDYFILQKRAAQCQLYAAAILFAELEKEHSKSDTVKDDNEKRLQLQYEIYSNIDDPDSFYGIKNPDLRDSFVNKLQHEGKWQRLFDFEAAKEEASSIPSFGNLSTLLHHQGFNKLSLQLNDKQATSYSAAWRQDQWDLPVDTIQSGTSQTLYSALRAVYQDGDAQAIQSVLDQAYQAEFNGIIQSSMESNVGIKDCVHDLLCLRETSQWCKDEASITSLVTSDFTFDDFERLTSVRLSLLGSQLQNLRSKHVGDMLDEEMIRLGKSQLNLLLSLSKEAREHSRVHISINAVTRAQQIAKDIPNLAVEEEFANLLWHLGDHATAIDALSGIVEGSLTEARTSIEMPVALARLGQWRATARSHQPLAIKEDCFKSAANMLVDSRYSNEQRALVMYQYATFAHEQYQILIRSDEAEDLKYHIRYRKEEIDQLEIQIKRNQNRNIADVKVNRSRERAQRLLAMDEEKLSDIEGGKKSFRKLAIYMYSKTLLITEAYDDKAVIRLMAIWFENALDDQLNHDLQKHLVDIPSHKFIPYVTQLSARLTINDDTEASTQSSSRVSGCSAFNVNIREVLERMCLDHPFHTLTSLYALSRADDDRNGRKAATRQDGTAASKSARQSNSNATLPQIQRKQAAIDLISHVAIHHLQRQRISQWKMLCDACVEWARFELQVHMADIFGPDSDRNNVIRTRSHAINSRLAITKVQDLDVPVLTRKVPIDLTCKYDHLVTIVKYNDRFSTAGGVHLPKICECIGSDGQIYKQLFKNRDDLRQDAIMQQVFGVLNNLLSIDRDANKRRLRVRTYIVLPLGPQYGLLEHVGNTRPIQSSIIATHNKHRRPGDITAHEARLRLQAFEFKGKTRAEQGINFDKVCSQFPPTFRFHFLENQKIPLTLLVNRLNYTRSVATNSIVGHILGLGDRHVSNILLDDHTGEVIHIDFGVAFDQGKLLPIPEMVPFRLTRDIVDGMGLHGVEGVYRRCCQETLRVMRQGSSVIETVLQVFKFDPLYDWTQNPIKVIKAQAHASQEAPPTSISFSNASSTMENAQRRRVLTRMNHNHNSSTTNNGQVEEKKDVAELLAERAIGTVKEKLSSHLSVEYTVNELIRQARDSANLGSIFSGWQAAL